MLAALNPDLMLGSWFRLPLVSMTAALTFMLVFVGIKLVTPGPKWIAPILMVVAATTFSVLTRQDVAISSVLITSMSGSATIVFVLYRLGLLPATLSFVLLTLVPPRMISLDPGAWYAGPTFGFLGVSMALLLFGFFTATAGQPWRLAFRPVTPTDSPQPQH